MAWLEIDGKRHELTTALVLGRSSTCDITLGDADTSRRHARVWMEDGAAWVEDLKTQNGTRINERRITDKSRLVGGDIIRIGQHRLTFMSEEVPPTEAPTMMSPPAAAAPPPPPPPAPPAPPAQPIPPVQVEAATPALEHTFHPDSAVRSSGTALPQVGGEVAVVSSNDGWSQPLAPRRGVPGWVVALVALLAGVAAGVATWFLVPGG
jgi:hypothetical protein